MPPFAAFPRSPPPETSSDTVMPLFGSKKDSRQGQVASIPNSASGIQRQTKASPDKAYSDNVCYYLDNVVGPRLVRRKETHLRDQDLKELNIKATGLDLTSGAARKPPFYSECYMRPTPSAYVQQWIKEKPPRITDWVLEGGGSLRDTNYAEARDVLHFLDSLLTRPPKCGNARSIDGSPILTEYTPWRRQHITTPHLVRKHPQRSDVNLWRIINLYRPTLDPRGSDVWAEDFDPDFSHTLATLAVEYDLDPTSVLTAEVQTIMLLACTYAALKSQSHHQLIPITLLTCSGCTCRVIQGIVTFQASGFPLELRISPNVHLNEGAKGNWSKIGTLMGWMTAQPVGRTRAW